jgi:FkbM family methyltransferase
VSVEDLVRMFVTSVEFRNRLTSTLAWTSGAPVAVDLLSGQRMYVLDGDSSVSSVIRAEREYEPHVASHLSARLAPGMVFVDVGASIGFYSVLAGRLVGPQGAVVACEPGPQNHSVLRLNIVSNRLEDRTEIFPVAVSDKPGVLLYSASGGNGAVAPYEDNPVALATHDLVPATTLDTVLGGRDRVDVVKIDVEGAEGLVLTGSRETLARHQPQLYFEFTPSSLSAVSGVEPEALLKSLEDIGYRFEVLHRARPPEMVGAAGVMAAYAQQDDGHIDVFASMKP